MSDVYLSLTDSQNNILLSINENATVLPLTPQPAGVSGSVSVTNVVSVNVVTMPAITVQATAASVTTIIGTVTISSMPNVNVGTVTLGPGNSQIGSVTASITGTVPVSISVIPASTVTVSSLPSLAAGTNQIGSVTASISGTVPVSLNTLPASTVTVSSLPSLAAGTAQIGSVTASISGTVPVSIASLPSLAAGTNQVGSVTASLNQGGTAVGSANPLQVTLANTGANSTAIKVDGSASTQPISGSVTACGQSSSATIYPLLVGEAYTSLQNSGGAGRVAVEPIDQNGNTLVQDTALKTLVTNSVTIGSLPAISGTVTANLSYAGNQLQWIKVTQGGQTEYCERINEFVWRGGQTTNDTITIYRTGQDRWETTGALFANGPFIGATDSRIPNTGIWENGDQDASIIISYEQPSIQQVTLQNSVTIGSLPVQLSTTTIGGTARLNVTLSSATTVGNTAPSYANLYGGSDGTNLRAILTDTSGRTVVTISNFPATQPVSLTSTTVTVSALPNGALTTYFGSVTTASTAQISAVTNTSRKYLLAQNISAGTVTIGIGFSPTTTKGIQLTAGAGITFDSFCPTGAVYWLSATTGANFTILEG